MADQPRIRLMFDTNDDVRRAVYLRALLTGQTHSDVLNGLIGECLADELRQVAAASPAPRRPKRKT